MNIKQLKEVPFKQNSRYSSFVYCLGNLLIQFNDSDNTTNTSSFTSLNFPYPYDSGSTPYSVVSSNYSSNDITFTNLAISLLYESILSNAAI